VNKGENKMIYTISDIMDNTFDGRLLYHFSYFRKGQRGYFIKPILVEIDIKNRKCYRLKKNRRRYKNGSFLQGYFADTYEEAVEAYNEKVQETKEYFEKILNEIETEFVR